MLRFVAIAFVMRLCRDRGRLARSFARRCVARLVRERAGGTPAVQSKSAVVDFDRFIEWPKPAYTRFRLTPGCQIRVLSIPMSQRRMAWRCQENTSGESLHERRRGRVGVDLHR